MPNLDPSVWRLQKEKGHPIFCSFGNPSTIMGLAFLPVESRIGVDVFPVAAVVMVITVNNVIVIVVVIVVIAVNDVVVMIVVIVVVVGVLALLVVPMVHRRVMLVRSLVVVVRGMVLNLRKTLFGGKTRHRDHRYARQAI